MVGSLSRRGAVHVAFALSAAAVVSLAMAGDARAAPPPPPPDAEAMRLFERASTLFESGNCAEAVPLFERVLEREASIGALLSLAECSLKEQKSATAWRYLQRAQRIARDRGDAREAEASKASASLAPRLPRLTVKLANPAQARDAQLVLDGQPIELAELERYPVDPGEHELIVRGPGRTPFAKQLALAAAEVIVVTVPDLEPVVAEGPPTPTPMPSPRPTPPERPPASGTGTGQRTIGLVVGGLGVVGLGLGTAFGIVALSKNSALRNACSGPCREDQRATTDPLYEDANEAATLSTASFIAGGVLGAAGVVLYVTAPHAESTSAGSRTPGLTAGFAPRPGGGMAAITGAW